MSERIPRQRPVLLDARPSAASDGPRLLRSRITLEQQRGAPPSLVVRLNQTLHPGATVSVTWLRHDDAYAVGVQSTDEPLVLTIQGWLIRGAVLKFSVVHPPCPAAPDGHLAHLHYAEVDPTTGGGLIWRDKDDELAAAWLRLEAKLRPPRTDAGGSNARPGPLECSLDQPSASSSARAALRTKPSVALA